MASTARQRGRVGLRTFWNDDATRGSRRAIAFAAKLARERKRRAQSRAARRRWEPASELSAGRIVADREGRSSGRASERASESCASDFGVTSGRGPGCRPGDSAGDDLPCSHGRHGAGYVRGGVTTPDHGGHGAGHGATHGFDDAGHGDHGGAERRAGPDSAAATAAGAAAFTIPYQGLEVEQPPPTNPRRQRCVTGGGPVRAKRGKRAKDKVSVR